MRSVPVATRRSGVVMRRERYSDSHTAPNRMSSAWKRYSARYTALIGPFAALALTKLL
jgi:hypothetical protein